MVSEHCQQVSHGVFVLHGMSYVGEVCRLYGHIWAGLDMDWEVGCRGTSGNARINLPGKCVC